VFDQEQIIQFGQKLLMIAGGFAAGYLGAWIACVGFDKTVVKGKSPDGLHKWARRIGGVLVALVVAFFLFRGGTGSGGGDGSGDGTGTGQASTSTSPQTSQTPATEKVPEVAVEAVPVRVTVYAGNAVERGTQKFFKVGDGGGMVELGEVSAEVRRQKEKAGKVGVVIVYTFDETASEGTTVFQTLRQEAKELGVPMLSDTQFRQLRK
jgi:hypothetical protein